MNSQKSRQKTGLFKQETEDKSDDSYDFDNESGKDVDADLEQYTFSEKNPNNLVYTLVDIKNPYELEQNCSVAYESKAGMNLYISFPYLLVMDETCAKLFLLQGQDMLKMPRLMHTFYEP